MKVRISNLLLITVLIALLLSLSGCVTEYKKEDIVKYVKENIGLSKFSISNSYQEVTDEEGYTDKLWTVVDKDKNITFHVLDDHFYGMESISNNLTNDYGDIIFKKYYDSLSPRPFTSVEKSRYSCGIDEIEVVGKYTNKTELERCYSEIISFGDYLEREKVNANIRYYIVFNGFPDSIEPFKTYGVEEKSGVLKADNGMDEYDESEIHQELLDNYFSLGIEYNLSNVLSEMTEKDRENVFKSKRNNLIYNVKDEEKLYPNLISTRGWSLTYNLVYEILKEEGFNPIGTSDYYSVTNNDGIKYTFSMNFYEKDEDGYYTFYHMKENEKEIDDKYGRIGTNVVNKIFGLNISTEPIE